MSKEKDLLDFGLEIAQRRNQLGYLPDRLLPDQKPSAKKAVPKSATNGKISQNRVIKFIFNKIVEISIGLLIMILGTIWLVKHKWL